MGGLARAATSGRISSDVVSQWLVDDGRRRDAVRPEDLGGRPRSGRPTRPARRSRRQRSKGARDALYRYLRALRGGIMFERRKLDHAEALIDRRRAVTRIDRARFEVTISAPRRDHRVVREPTSRRCRSPRTRRVRQAPSIAAAGAGSRISFPSAVFVQGGRQPLRGAWGSDSADVERCAKRHAWAARGKQRANRGSPWSRSTRSGGSVAARRAVAPRCSAGRPRPVVEGGALGAGAGLES